MHSYQPATQLNLCASLLAEENLSIADELSPHDATHLWSVHSPRCEDAWSDLAIGVFRVADRSVGSMLDTLTSFGTMGAPFVRNTPRLNAYIIPATNARKLSPLILFLFIKYGVLRHMTQSFTISAMIASLSFGLLESIDEHDALNLRAPCTVCAFVPFFRRPAFLAPLF